GWAGRPLPGAPNSSMASTVDWRCARWNDSSGPSWTRSPRAGACLWGPARSWWRAGAAAADQSSACGPCARGWSNARTGWRDGSFLTGLAVFDVAADGARAARAGPGVAWTRHGPRPRPRSRTPCDAVLSAVI